MTQNDIKSNKKHSSTSIRDWFKFFASCLFYILLMLFSLVSIICGGLGIAASLGMDLSEVPLGGLLFTGIAVGLGYVALRSIGRSVSNTSKDDSGKSSPQNQDSGVSRKIDVPKSRR